MAQNQHYVPQFYLRNFSKDSKSINIYHLESEKRLTGSIKGQCSKRNFYGDDEKMEKAFSQFESSASSTIKRIIRDETFRIPLPEYVELLTFILWQSVRTMKASEDNLNFANQVFDFFKPDLVKMEKAKELGITIEDLNMFEVTHRCPALESSITAMNCVTLMGDMKIALLINKAKREFITSDSPVVLFNPYFNEREKGSQTGYASKGLQIFYPITPKYMIVMYDPEYYEIPINDDLSFTITKNKDVRRLNGLQLVYCLNNVYYSEYNVLDLQQQHKELKKKRGHGNIIEVAGVRQREDGYTSELIRASRDHPKYDLKKLSFMKIIPGADPVPGIRNEETYEKYEADKVNLYKEIDDVEE